MKENEIDFSRVGEKIKAETLLQLEKDIGQCGVLIELSPLFSMARIHEILIAAVSEIISRKKLSLLLNRVDISERQLKEVNLDVTSDTFVLKIADLILKRSLQKVVIRNYYSNDR